VIMAESQLVVEVVGRRGALVLNRPAALNALNLELVRDITAALKRFSEDSGIDFVTVSSANPRAFCAGGDLRAIRNAVLAGTFDEAEAFFSEEYALNEMISFYPKPYVSLIQGVCFGGGMGLSVHGRHRIMAHSATMAMPEGAIGFFADIGASYFLNRLEGALGLYVALTGQRLESSDAVYCGLATSRAPDDEMLAMLELSVEANARILSLLKRATPTDETSRLQRIRSEIDFCFGGGSLDEICSRLRGCEADWSASALESIERASPTSSFINYSLLERMRGYPLRSCLAFEFQLARRVLRSRDFLEGTRAILVDKDKAPKWGAVDHKIFEEAWDAFRREQIAPA
jgi:enoyl-CoA hydratase